MKITGTLVLALLTAILLVGSVAFAIETLLAENVEGIQLVDKQRCEVDRGYYSDNETECDGFVYWFLFFTVPWVLIIAVWLIKLRHKLPDRVSDSRRLKGV